MLSCKLLMYKTYSCECHALDHQGPGGASRDIRFHTAKESGSFCSSETTCFHAGFFFVTFNTQFPLAEVYAGAPGLSQTAEGFTSLATVPTVGLWPLVLFVSSVLKADKILSMLSPSTWLVKLYLSKGDVILSRKPVGGCGAKGLRDCWRLAS